MNSEKNFLQVLDREKLKILAMLLMLLDHAYMTVVHQPGYEWMTMAGRLAFPIFAFQITEGYLHTRNRKNYIRQMFLFALLSEIPYNLMMGGELIGPFHQNVMFTFWIALLLLALLDKLFASRWPLFVKALLTALICLLSVVAGTLAFVDYSGFGVLTVLIFYLARKMPNRFLCMGMQAAGLWLINGIFLGGKILLLPYGLEFPEQGLALLSLVLIWAYNGEKSLSGKKETAFKYGAYLFYPLHIFLLSMMSLYLV
jgi:hypothetical protein